MSKRITFNANVSEIGDIAKFISTLKAWRPGWVVLMNSIGSANFQAISDAMRSWNGHIIYRVYEESDGHLWRTRTVDEHFRLLSSLAAIYPYLWFYVSNEPIPGDSERQRMMDWHAQLIDKCAAAGIRLCVGNLAIAAMGSKSDIDAGRWDTLLRKFGEYADRRADGEAQILLGVHTYGHALIPWHCAGRNPNELDEPDAITPDKWPTASEVYNTPEDNWLLFREDWYAQRIKALTGKSVDVAITEFGWDRMPNIVGQFPQVTATLDKLAQTEIRGLPTLPRYFEAISPAAWEQTACRQLEWAERIYPENYRCFALFTWSHNRLWKEGYSVDSLDKFLQLWPTYTSLPAPEPEQPGAPKPGYAVIDSPSAVNVRRDAGINFDTVGTIRNGEKVTIEGVKLDAERVLWTKIKRAGYGLVPTIAGWVSSRVARFETYEPANIPADSVVIRRIEHDALLADRAEKQRLESHLENMQTVSKSLAEQAEAARLQMDKALQCLQPPAIALNDLSEDLVEFSKEL